MSGVTRLRVLVALGDPPIPAWHDRVVETLRAAGAEVEISIPGVPQSFDPHIVVDLRGGTSTPTTGREPPLGVWRYGFGDGRPLAGGATGTIARLYRSTADPARAFVLHEGWFKGDSGESRGTVSVEDRVAPWCGRVLSQLVRGDLDALTGPLAATDGCREPVAPRRRRGVGALVDGLHRWRRREQWAIGISVASLEDVLGRGTIPEPRWVTGPAGGFFADPFPVAAPGGSMRLLAEQYHYAVGRGSIVALDVTCAGDLISSREWIAATHHAAYPFVLRDGERTFCVPEVAGTSTVRAYAIDSDGSSFQTMLEGFPAVDPTIARHDGRWWLFCTHRDVENQTELHLFHADDWRGPWRSHPLNPVKSDARSSRPAGATFVLGGALYRPAQDCSHRYGGAIAINRIVEMTTTRFREEQVLTLHPSPAWPYPDGLHTLNAHEGVVVIDALKL